MRCLECGLVHMWPLPPRDLAREMVNDYAWTRDYSGITTEAISVATSALGAKLAIARRLRPDTPFRSFLDVGCGNGLYLFAARNLGLVPAGTELDRTNAQGMQSHGLDVRHGFIEDMDFGGRTFDFVHIKSVLFFSRNPLAMLSASAALLAPGGMLYVDVSNQHGLFSLLRLLRPTPARFGQLEPPLHPVAFCRRSLRVLLQRSGLQGQRLVSFSFGDPIYYPYLCVGNPEPTLEASSRWQRPAAWRHGILRGVDALGLGGFLATYAIRSGDASGAERNFNLGKVGG